MSDKPATIDLGRAETPLYEPEPEVKAEFAHAAGLDAGAEWRPDQAPEDPPLPPEESADETHWVDTVGEEAVGGGNPTPEQDVVEELGEAMGLTYEDNEPLGGERKLHHRDAERWELNPASAESDPLAGG